MGKRKKSSRGPTGPKKREGLATSFKCVFCNNENSVSVKIDKKSAVGTLSCKQCGQNYQTTTNSLSAPVDVYFDWIDACDEVAKDQATTATFSRGSQHLARPNAASELGGMAPEKYADDGFVVDDEPDAEAEFDDED